MCLNLPICANLPTAEQKSEIVEYINNNPYVPRAEVGKKFIQKFDQIITKSVLARLYQNEDSSYQNDDKQKYRAKQARFPEFEKELVGKINDRLC